VRQHEQLATPTSDLDWILVEEGFTLAREHEVDALSSPATFLAGAFGLEETGSSLGLRQVADWTYLSATIDEHSLQLDGEDADPDGQVNASRIVALFEDCGLFEIEAR
jgi:hypothetical protein